MDGKNKLSNRGLVLVIVSVVGLGLMFYLANNVIPQVMVTLTKATPATQVSVSNSYVLGVKMVAKSDGSDKTKINVFLLDKEGKGVGGKSVSISGIEKVDPPAAISDKNGLVSFEMTSTTEGQFPITAMVEGIPLTKTITVTFVN